MQATSPSNLPDLIQAVATNGKEGYVKLTDYKDPQPKSPEEAAQWTLDHHGKTRTIPVYDQDGTTKIGEFVITTRNSSLLKASRLRAWGILVVRDRRS